MCGVPCQDGVGITDLLLFTVSGCRHPAVHFRSGGFSLFGFPVTIRNTVNLVERPCKIPQLLWGNSSKVRTCSYSYILEFPRGTLYPYAHHQCSPTTCLNFSI
jgi:hypothetical protein